MANICRINEILYQLIFGIFRHHFFGDHFGDHFRDPLYIINVCCINV